MLVVVEVVVRVVVEVVVLVVVEVVVLVVVEVVVVVTMITAIVLSMTNGLGPPPGPVPSSRFPPPNTPAVAVLFGGASPPIAGIVQGNGPNCTVTSFARMPTFVKRFVIGGPLGCPIASGHLKSAVTAEVLHPD